jgi:hypothetical protein
MHHLLTVNITWPDGELLEQVKIIELEPGRDPIAVAKNIVEHIERNYETVPVSFGEAVATVLREWAKLPKED